MSIPPQPPSAPGPYSQPGPYGQPGQPGPYVGGPQGWYAPQSQKTNALAIVAFVMSLVCALPLVPLVLGFVALSQIRTRGEKGKGLAIAAIVIHGVTIAFYGIFVVLGLTGALDDTPPKRDTSGAVTEPASSGVNDVRVGDCFNTTDDLSDYHDKEGGQAALSVRIVPCAQPHKGETYAVINLDDGVYPGADKIIAIAEEKCAGQALISYVGADAKLPDKLEMYYYYPQASTWIRDDRKISCFVGDPTGPSTGSVRVTGS
ncbi:DUF4190 domain-containing protein [Streptomyces sp. NPDC097617]|uniref:DUF4190 domain-containing protein n=1 Tax=Streptomyces sp. NPDC097617 TaxID=3366091 RepID=UPI00381F1DCD